MNKQQFAQWEKESKMVSLIKLAIDRMDVDDLLTLVYERCIDATQREYLNEKMISLLNSNGSVFIVSDKGMGIDKKGKLIEFIEKEIYPTYNEQKNSIFSY